MDAKSWEIENLWWESTSKAPPVSRNWAEIHQRVISLLDRLPCGKGLNNDTREDVVQEVMLKLHKGLCCKLAECDKPGDYLGKTILNAVRDIEKSVRRRTKAMATYAELSRLKAKADERPDQQVAWAERIKRVWFHVMHVATMEDRRLLTMFYLDGMKVSDIATKLKITKDAVGMRLARARLRIYKANP